MYLKLRTFKKLLTDEGPDFLELESLFNELKNILQNPLQHQGPNEESLKFLDRGQFEPLEISGYSKQSFPKEYLCDALTLSRALQLNERIALELVYNGSRQLMFYPGMTSGLVAVLLLYDCKLMALECLFHLSAVYRQPVSYSEAFVQKASALFNSTLFENILGQISRFNWSNEKQNLAAVNGIGENRHSHEIRWRISKVRNCCAHLFQVCSDKLTEVDINNIFLFISNGSLEKISSSGFKEFGRFDCCSRDVFLNHLCNSMINIISQWFSGQDSIDDQNLSLIQATCQQIRCRQDWKSSDLLALFRFAIHVNLRWINNFSEKNKILQQLDSDDDVAIEESVDQGALQCLCDLCETFLDCSLAWNESRIPVRQDVSIRHLLVSRFITVVPGYIEELRFACIRGSDEGHPYKELLNCFIHMYEISPNLSGFLWTMKDQSITDALHWNVRKCIMASCDAPSAELVPIIFRLLKSLSVTQDGAGQTYQMICNITLNNDEHYLSLNRIFNALCMYLKTTLNQRISTVDQHLSTTPPRSLSHSNVDASNVEFIKRDPSVSRGSSQSPAIERVQISAIEHNALVCALQTLTTVCSNNSMAALKLTGKCDNLLHFDIVDILSKLVALPMPVVLKGSSFEFLTVLLNINPDVVMPKILPLISTCLRSEAVVQEIQEIENRQEHQHTLFRSVIKLLIASITISMSSNRFSNVGSSLLPDVINFICTFSVNELKDMKFSSQIEEFNTVQCVVQSIHSLLKKIVTYSVSCSGGSKDVIHLRKEGVHLLHCLGKPDGCLSVIMQIATRFTDKLLRYSSIEDVDVLSKTLQRIFDLLYMALAYQEAITSFVTDPHSSSNISTISFPVNSLILRIASSDRYPRFLMTLMRFIHFFNDFPCQCRRILDCLSLLLDSSEGNMVSYICKCNNEADIIRESFLKILDTKSLDKGEQDCAAISEASCRRKLLQMILESLTERNDEKSQIFAYYLLSVKVSHVLPSNDSNGLTIHFPSGESVDRSAFFAIAEILQNGLTNTEYYKTHFESVNLCSKIVYSLAFDGRPSSNLSKFIKQYLREIDDLIVGRINDGLLVFKTDEIEHLEFISYLMRLLAIDLSTLRECGHFKKLKRVQAILTQSSSVSYELERGPLVSHMLWQLSTFSKDTNALREERSNLRLNQNSLQVIESIMKTGPLQCRSFDWNGRTFRTELIDVDALLDKYGFNSNTMQSTHHGDGHFESVERDAVCEKALDQVLKFAQLYNKDKMVCFGCCQFICAWSDLIQTMESVFSFDDWDISGRITLLKEFRSILNEIEKSDYISFEDRILPFSMSMCFLACGVFNSLIKVDSETILMYCTNTSTDESWHMSIKNAWHTLTYLISMCTEERSRGFLFSAMLSITRSLDYINKSIHQESKRVKRNKVVLAEKSGQSFTVSLNAHVTLMISKNIYTEKCVNQELSVALLLSLVRHNHEFLRLFAELGCVHQLLDGVVSDASDINRLVVDDSVFHVLKSKLNLLLYCLTQTPSIRSLRLVQFNKLFTLNTLSEMYSLQNQSAIHIVLNSTGIVRNEIKRKFCDLSKVLLQLIVSCLFLYDLTVHTDVKLQVISWFAHHEDLLSSFITSSNDDLSFSLAVTAISILSSYYQIIADKGFRRAIYSLVCQIIDVDLWGDRCLSKLVDESNQIRTVSDFSFPILLRSICGLVACLNTRLLDDLKGIPDQLVALSCTLLSIRSSLLKRVSSNKKQVANKENSERYNRLTKQSFNHGKDKSLNTETVPVHDQITLHDNDLHNGVSVDDNIQEILFWIEQTAERILVLIWHYLDIKLCSIEPGIINRLINLPPHRLSEHAVLNYSRLLQGVMPISINQELCSVLNSATQQGCSQTLDLNNGSSKPSKFNDLIQFITLRLSRLCMFLSPGQSILICRN